MAKPPVKAPAKKADVSGKLAKGKVSPVDAAKARHGANVVLGKVDSTYHFPGAK